MKKTKNDYIYYFLLFMLVLAVVVTIQYIINIKVNDCTLEPLSYGARHYEKHYGEVAYGVLYFENGNKPYNYFTFNEDGNLNFTEYP